MVRYKNLGGDSGVAGYSLGNDSIIVVFNQDPGLPKYVKNKKEFVSDACVTIND